VNLIVWSFTLKLVLQACYEYHLTWTWVPHIVREFQSVWRAVTLDPSWMLRSQILLPVNDANLVISQRFRTRLQTTNWAWCWTPALTDVKELSLIAKRANSCLQFDHWCLIYVQRRSAVCIRCCTAGVDKWVHSTSLYHCRQCSIVLKPRSDRIHQTVVCFMTHDCSRTLWKHSTTSASWVWFTLC